MAEDFEYWVSFGECCLQLRSLCFKDLKAALAPEIQAMAMAPLRHVLGVI